MSRIVRIDDIIYTTKECVKLLTGTNYNDWERQFIQNIHELVNLDTALTPKQIYHLYKIYFKHIEGDIDELENWCREYGFIEYWRTDLDKSVRNY